MNKGYLCMALLTSVGFSTSLGQPRQGNWELSTSAMMGSLSTTTETKTAVEPRPASSWSSTYITLALRIGYYPLERLAVEPEVFFNAIENRSPIYILSANLAYNHPIPETDLTPFILAGYGVGNSIPSLIGATPLLIVRFSDEFDIPVLQLGVGLKYRVGQHAAIRTEYRYQRYSLNEDLGSGSSSTTTLNYNNVFIGISMFL